MRKRIVNLFILILGCSFVFPIVSGKISMECLFKKIFHISCPACGITRCFRAIMRFDFIRAFEYNILGVSLFVLGIIYGIFLIRDIVNGSSSANRLLLYFFKKYYLVIIGLLIISMVINNIRGI